MKRDRIEGQHESELFTAILALKTPDEARNFFYDLCTPAELSHTSPKFETERSSILCIKSPTKKPHSLMLEHE